MKKWRIIFDRIAHFRVLLLTLAALGLFVIALFWVVIPQFESLMLDRKREMIKELTYSAVSMIQSWQQREANGTLSRVEAQQSAIHQLEQLRYGEDLKDYFWVTDGHPTMIMHPYRPDLNGQDLSWFSDSNQKLLFVEMVRVVDAQSEGFVDYRWQWKDDSTRIVPKLSFVRLFEPWGWIVGTGIYIEDVKDEIARLEQKIILISVLVTILTSLILGYIAYQNFQSERRRRAAEAELHESREKYRLLVEASGEGLIMVLEDRQVYLNRTLYAMLGYVGHEDELEFANMFRVQPQAVSFDFGTRLRNPGSTDSESVECELLCRDGGVIQAVLSISPITFLSREGVVISVKDISRHQEMQKVLDDTQEKYLALTAQLTMGVFRAAAEGSRRFIELNPAMKGLLALPEGEDAFDHSLFEFFIDPEQADGVLNDLSATGAVKNRIVRLKTLRNTPVTVSLSAVLVRDLRGRPLSIDGVVEDISEQFRTQRDRENLIFDLQTSVHTLSQSIGHLIKELPSCNHTATIRTAVATFTAHDSRALLVTGSHGEEMGLVTDRDLRERAFAADVDLESPVYTIMSAPIRSVRLTATIYEALVTFRKHRVRRLVVKRADHSIAGVLTLDDLFDASYDQFLFFIKNIEQCEHISKLRDYREQLLILIRSLIEYDTTIHSVTNFVTLISDTITRRLIELAIRDLGAPPLPFAFLTMGSEGREEQTLATDQDNAIVYAEPDAGQAAAVRDYFSQLAERVCADLDTVGYQLCRGGIMAKNEKWCQPLPVWKRYFTDWVTTATPQNLLETKIFFDFRFVYGDDALASALQAHVQHLSASVDTFFIYLAESLLGTQIPETMQKFKTPLDAKLLLLPIVDVARLYALKQRLAETNTVRRLAAMREAGALSTSLHRSLVFYYSQLMQLRLRRQLEAHEERTPVDNMVALNRLMELDQVLLKNYFEVLETVKTRIRSDFKGVTF